MAARKNLEHDQRTREKIQTSQLINRLQSNALGKLKADLSASQLKSIEILLRKALPDLSSVELKGEGGGPIQSEAHIDISGLSLEMQRAIAKVAL
jgi:hypothetical protein